MTDLTIAVSEKTFQRMFRVLRDGFRVSTSGALPGDVRIAWDVRCHMENGTVNLQDDNSIDIEELDIVVDRLRLSFGIDLPRYCVGGQCILRNPLTGNCVVRLPRVCVFESNPDLSVSLNLDGLFRSEVTAACRLYAEYFNHPSRDEWPTNYDAAVHGAANEWQVYVRPFAIDVDHFDMAASAQAAFDAAIAQAVNHALAPLPGWVRDLVIAAFGPIGTLIERIMDVPDDINEWLSDLFNLSIGFLDFIYDRIVGYLADDSPIHKFQDPLEIVPRKGALIPVFTRFHFVRAEVNATEMIITADAGLA